jgi:hypothetical protein
MHSVPYSTVAQHYTTKSRQWRKEYKEEEEEDQKYVYI